MRKCLREYKAIHRRSETTRTHLESHTRRINLAKFHEFTVKYKFSITDRTISILADKYGCFSFVHVTFLHFCIIVILFTVDHEDDICILLDRTRFTEVRENWLLAGTTLNCSRELREGDNRDIEFTSERFESARYI